MSETLNFNLNQPKMLSSTTMNSVNTPFTPNGFQEYSSSPAANSKKRYIYEKKYLKPAPRDQTLVPTDVEYKGKIAQYYKEVLGNGNFVRGNQFGVKYPYEEMKPLWQQIDNPTVKYSSPDNLDKPVDYLESNAKIMMRHNSPYYPYPSLGLEKKKDYWTYPHEKRFLNMQPIYKYPFGKTIGIPEGKYNPFLLESFYQKTDKKEIISRELFGIIVLIFVFCLYFAIPKK